MAGGRPTPVGQLAVPGIVTLLAAFPAIHSNMIYGQINPIVLLRGDVLLLLHATNGQLHRVCRRPSDGAGKL